MARLFVCVTLVLAAAAQAQPPQKTDHERLQGKWEIVATVSDTGKKKAVTPNWQFMTFEGDKMWFETGGSAKGKPNDFRLHTGTNPRQIDLAFTPQFGASGNKRNPAQGVYQLDGDVLKLCFKMLPTGLPADAKTPDVRPKSVEPGQGTYYELRRAPK